MNTSTASAQIAESTYGPGSRRAAAGREAGPSRWRVGTIIPLLALTLLLAACGKKETHPLRGTIVEVYREPPALLVDHEEIPGFMAAMTMRFEVDANTAATAQKGQQISGRLRYHDGTWYLEDVRSMP